MNQADEKIKGSKKAPTFEFLDYEPLNPIRYHSRMMEKNLDFLPYHWHEDIEILHVTNGEGYIYIGKNPYYVTPGVTCISSSKELHSIFPIGDLSYNCFAIDPKFGFENGFDISKIKYEEYIRDSKLSAIIAEAVKVRIENELPSAPFRIPNLRNAALNILTYLNMNHVVNTDQSTTDTTPDFILNTLKYINSNYSKKLNLDELVKVTNTSKFYLITSFKKYTGKTIVEYITLLRCEKAKGLLQNTQMSIKSIARECGFQTESYFSKKFCQITGILPSQLRNS